MFLDGGISGFFNDLYYGAVEKGYKLTHPRIWDCVLKSQAEAMEDSDGENEEIIHVLQSIGVEDEELFSLIEEVGDMDSMSRKEAEGLIKKLQKKEVTIDFARLAETLENDVKMQGNKAAVTSSKTMNIPQNDMKEHEKQKTDDFMKMLRIIGGKMNPYDTFPEEKKYYSFDEIMEIMQSLYHMKEKADLSEG